MARKNFIEVLQSAGIDIKAEYRRLHKLFYEPGHECLYDLCDAQFLYVPFRGTCISLEDFNITHNFDYHTIPEEITEDDLVDFCEYTFNMLKFMPALPYDYHSGMTKNDFFIQTLFDIIGKIGYQDVTNENGVTIFVPKSQSVFSVSEILPTPISYDVIEYNHFRMKGDLNGKRESLVKLAHLIEPKKKDLQSINHSLSTNVFFMLNNLNLRHNNVEPGSSNYKKITAMMKDTQLEELYDDLYQLLLLAFLEMDNVNRIQKIEDLKKQYAT